jgi:hypothetical protein
MEEFKYIYKMEWFEKPNSRKSDIIMYYVNEKDTRFGHDWPIGLNGSNHCKISVIKVKENSDEYKSALNNSNNKKNAN